MGTSKKVPSQFKINCQKCFGVEIDPLRGVQPQSWSTGKKENFLFQVNKLYLLESEKNVYEFLYPENPHPDPIGARPETPTTRIRDFLKGSEVLIQTIVKK